jgi:hypothetical protein
LDYTTERTFSVAVSGRQDRAIQRFLVQDFCFAMMIKRFRIVALSRMFSDVDGVIMSHLLNQIRSLAFGF